MADKMVELTIEEVSGVDDPANLVPGWLVLKGRSYLDQLERGLEDSVSATATDTSATELEQAAAETRGALQKMLDLMSGRKKEASPEETAAVDERLTKMLDDRFAELVQALKAETESGSEGESGNTSEDDSKSDGDNGEVEETTAKAEERIKGLEESLEATRDALLKALDRIEALEKRSTSKTSVTGQETAEGTTEKETEKSTRRGSLVSATIANGRIDVR